MHGTHNEDGSWCCAYPGCQTKSVFKNPYLLRRHFDYHEEQFFCSYDSCPRSKAGAKGGFCRKDNLTVHIWRIHQKKEERKPGVEYEDKNCKRSGNKKSRSKSHAVLGPVHSSKISKNQATQALKKVAKKPESSFVDEEVEMGLQPKRSLQITCNQSLGDSHIFL